LLAFLLAFAEGQPGGRIRTRKMLGSNSKQGVDPCWLRGNEGDPVIGLRFGPIANSWKGQMLTDIKCRTEKAVGGKEKKISDGFGLYLLVKPRGTKLWQMAYRFDGRQKKLSFGILWF
jgi:hypothetical protein